jgi:hypothetical protein
MPAGPHSVDSERGKAYCRAKWGQHAHTKRIVSTCTLRQRLRRRLHDSTHTEWGRALQHDTRGHRHNTSFGSLVTATAGRCPAREEQVWMRVGASKSVCDRMCSGKTRNCPSRCRAHSRQLPQLAYAGHQGPHQAVVGQVQRAGSPGQPPHTYTRAQRVWRGKSQCASQNRKQSARPAITARADAEAHNQASTLHITKEFKALSELCQPPSFTMNEPNNTHVSDVKRESDAGSVPENEFSDRETDLGRQRHTSNKEQQIAHKT